MNTANSFVESSNIDAILTSWCRILKESPQVGNTKESLFAKTVLTNPCNVWISNQARKHNAVVQIAETVWVLAGRNDMSFLARFLPRATDWVDSLDKMEWRAGYGPRLRAYYGIIVDDLFAKLPYSIDQVYDAFYKLRESPSSRQAYISIWDPCKDNSLVKSKDFPCNVGIHFLIRDNKLHCVVFNRSNDLIWGLTGINIVEFTTLQRVMASWLNVDVGIYTHYSSSLHYYEQMEERVNEILSNTISRYDDLLYKPTPLDAPPFEHSLEFFELICEIDTLYEDDPILARSDLGQLQHYYNHWPEFTAMLSLPLFFKREELKHHVRLDKLHPVLRYNLTHLNSLGYQV